MAAIGQVLRAGIAAVVLALLALTPAWAGGDWNDGQVQWQPYAEGLQLAKKTKKPICLVFYTDWCPHCNNYSGVFHDPKVVAKSNQFVMIRLNSDENKELGQQYAGDGQYIPRTFFLSPEGKLEPAIALARDRFKYFYDEKNPASLLDGMDEALKKLR
ncbi:MAG: thioredoxin family protein [Deltaproteobacteria bacterium]|nr:thioredoxin family protein [Deltaproteobacteria bacterium]